jgi:hypothetical protein
MPKFEYKVIAKPENSFSGVIKEVHFLNDYGFKGWELVSILPGQYGHINLSKDSDRKFTLDEFSNALSETRCKNYYFKRRKEIGDKLRAAQQKKEVPNNDDKNGPGEITGGLQE